MNLIKKLFAKSPYEEAAENLRRLGKNFMNGISTAEELVQWEDNFDIIYSRDDKHWDIFVDSLTTAVLIQDMFKMYLLKHYPEDSRLKEEYENEEDLKYARKKMYREMAALTLVQALEITCR